MNLILLGAPGSGKGTQARLLQEHYHLTLIATGEILREEVCKGTPLGLEVKEKMDAGIYLSDDIILRVFEERLLQSKDQGVILDGVPRTLNQAQKIDAMFDRLGLEIDGIIQLTVDDKELIQRISSRTICKTCGASYSNHQTTCGQCSGTEFMRRKDDDPETVKSRLDVYNEQAKPLTDYYRASNRLKVVDGMQSVEDVYKQIEKILSSLAPGCHPELVSGIS